MRTYVKKNFRYWNMKKINRYSSTLWYLIVILMGMVVTYALISWVVNRGPLVDPRCPASFGKVEQVQASEFISCENVVGYIRCKFYQGEITEKEAKTLIAIGKAESGLRENAKNRRSTASGVFQIVAPTWYQYRCTGDVLNFKDNTNCAIKIMKKDGSFRAWDAFNRGMHLQFVDSVVI